MNSINKVTLIGNVGQDPEYREFSNGGRMCSLRLATSERWKDKASGELKENTEWHSVIILAERLVDLCQRFVTKGSKLYIEGQLSTRKWQDVSGNDRYTTEVQLRPYSGQLVFLDPKKQYDDTGTAQASGHVSEPRDEIPF